MNGYLVVAYFVGERLTRTQVSIMNAMYLAKDGVTPNHFFCGLAFLHAFQDYHHWQIVERVGHKGAGGLPRQMFGGLRGKRTYNCTEPDRSQAMEVAA